MDILGDVTVSTTGSQDVDRMWTSVCDIIVSTTWGQDMDIFGVTVQPACPLEQEKFMSRHPCEPLLSELWSLSDI